MIGIFDDPFKIEGQDLVMLPLSLDHIEDLTKVALHDSVWEYNLKTIKERTRDGIEHYVRNLLQERSVRYAVPFVIQNKATGELIGMAKFDNIIPRHQRLDIGGVWIGAPHDAAIEIPKVLHNMAQYAFDELEVERLGFILDERHSVLRSGIETTGATCEGILRHFFLYPNGEYGNFASYSILSEEWAKLKK